MVTIGPGKQMLDATAAAIAEVAARTAARLEQREADDNR